MKNIKSLILPIIFASSTLVHSTPPTIHQIGKVASWISLPISVFTLLNGITGEKNYQNKKQQDVFVTPFTYYKRALKGAGLGKTSLAFMVKPIQQLIQCGMKQQLPVPDLRMTIVGALATAGSIAGIWYCKKQIEAQKKEQPSHPNS